MKDKKQSILDIRRRDFLKTVGNAGLASGLLKTSALTTGMMLSRAADAAVGDITSVIFLYVPGGAPYEGGQNLFIPSYDGIDLTMRSASMALDSVKDQCVFLSDASVSGGGGHGSTTKCFGGNQRPDTYDVELERTLGADFPYPSLLLGVQSAYTSQGYATKKDWQEVSYQDNPIAAFNRVFGGIDTTSTIPDPTGETDNTRAISILDVQKAEIEALSKSLGSFEKERLDEHLTSLEKIESRLNNAATPGAVGSCPIAASFNSDGFAFDVNDRTKFAIEADLQTDIAVAALSCKLTSVVSIMHSNHQSEQFDLGLNYTDTYHQSIHGGNATTHAETRNFLAERTRYLIETLSTTPNDKGGFMIDSTLVVQVTDMADGNAHSTNNAPMFFAGGGSCINRGILTSMGSDKQHNNMFDTVTELLGLTDVVPQLGNGPIPGIII